MTTDEFLARRLMGYEACSCGDGYTINGKECQYWSPTTNITQALGDGGDGTVVGEMRKRGWRIGIDWEPGKEVYCAIHWPTGGVDRPLYDTTAPTPAEVICEAARKALEAEKK